MKYDISLCEKVIDLGREGKTQAQMARDLNIGRSTFFEWIDKYPEFKEAAATAKFYEMAWWEDLLQKKLVASEPINGFVWVRRMGCRFKDDYGQANNSEDKKVIVEVKSFNGSKIAIKDNEHNSTE